MTTKDSKKSTISDRFTEIRRHFCDGNNANFAQMLDLDTKRVSNYCGGSKNPGPKVIEKVLEVFPQLSRQWLFFGEGPMLKQEGGTNVMANGDNNKIAGHDINECTKLEALYEARISDLQDRVSHQRAIIDSLTRTLEAMANK